MRSAEFRRPSCWQILRIFIAALIFAGLMLLLTGCTFTGYRAANGEQFTRVAIGSKTSVGELRVSGDTNGVKTLLLKSYSNDQVEALSAVTEAAVKGAVNSAK
jgi:hypothetical protein